MSEQQSERQLERVRHSLSHLLAAAVLEMHPDAKLAIGPATDEGFYYDFDLDATITPEQLPAIEERMRKLVDRDLAFERFELGTDEAIEREKRAGQPYKVELLRDLKAEGESMVSYFRVGSFEDLCKGPHVETTGQIGAFKLDRVAGAYWRGDEGNAMLQRVYGLAFATPKELRAYEAMRKQAKKRDHRVLGKKLGLFTFSDLVGSGLPLWTPKGKAMMDVLDQAVWQLRKRKGYERVHIPHITKKDLYETSGHWDKFKEELFHITTREGHEFVLKPMNCPHHTQIYAHAPRSYRDLPVRYAETTSVYRDEQSGELSGLSRVRAITMDDAHVFCTEDQLKQEALAIWEVVDEFYAWVGFSDLSVRLSLHDPDQPGKYLGLPEVWQRTEDQLRELVRDRGVAATEVPGEAAFYGPKIDFVAKDSLGREWQVATIQVDRNMPERFGLAYTNEKGEDEIPVMLHAAVMGSAERFISIMIEHYAGAFPLWFAPVQVLVASVGEEHADFALSLVSRLQEAGIRARIDDSDETVANKIRKAEGAKVPYMLVIGDREKESGMLSVRMRGRKDTASIAVEEFVRGVAHEIHDHVLELGTFLK